MTRRRLWWSLIAIVGVALGLLTATLVTGQRPVLGLDLQGGVSVILRPDDGASDDDLLVIRDLIRDELEQRGIAEPDVRVEGTNIVVDLPGVKDQQDALDAVDVAGIVTFRPVITCGLGMATDPVVPTGSTVATTTTIGAGVGPTVVTTTPTTIVATGDTSGATVPGDDADATPSGFAGRRAATPTTPVDETTATGGSAAPDDSSGPVDSGDAAVPATTTPLIDPSVVTGGMQQLLPTTDGDQCLVGPSAGSGEIFNRNSASVEFSGSGEGWLVVATLSTSGEAAWNAVATSCYQRSEQCPSQQLAIVLDEVIQTAPVVQTPTFAGEVSISGNDESGARSLARVIDRGAFPVRVEPATVQTVSPTLGRDSLNASVIAGLVGIALVLVMLVVFYRWLTLLVLAGMAVWGVLVYVAAALISEWTNYALTLAGVTGIIVSIGMTVDSYVIFFERLKDEVRHGRTLRNSAPRAFSSTWRTILAANLVSAIGAAVLFVLSVGSVRGFALYLGVTTVCDVIVLWFFTRPAVVLATGTGWLDRRNTFGLEVPRAATADTTAADTTAGGRP